VALAREIAMHVAATNPTYITKAEVAAETLQKAEEVFRSEVTDKPAEMQTKIVEGKMASYFKEQILSEQPFIKNPDITIGEMVTGAVQKFGENVSIAKISRLSVK
jgi:elongation factor Ts